MYCSYNFLSNHQTCIGGKVANERERLVVPCSLVLVLVLVVELGLWSLAWSSQGSRVKGQVLLVT